jgi:hypothetical protein
MAIAGRVMKTLFTTFLYGLVLIGTAEAGMTRVAIMLNGEGCAVQRQMATDALSKISGVVNVDGRTIPDHLLVDVQGGDVTADQLLRTVNDMLSLTPCKAEEMKSCITADLALSHTLPAKD